MKKITFYYFDNDNDKNCLENEEDFLAFFNLNNEKEKIVEGEINENENGNENQENVLKKKPEEKSLYSCAPILNSLYNTEIKNVNNENEENNKGKGQMSQIIKKDEKLPILGEKIINDEVIKSPFLSNNKVEDYKLNNDNIIKQKKKRKK